eukprot:2133917-Rhodomonas_salina.3
MRQLAWVASVRKSFSAKDTDGVKLDSGASELKYPRHRCNAKPSRNEHSGVMDRLRAVVRRPTRLRQEIAGSQSIEVEFAGDRRARVIEMNIPSWSNVDRHG